MKIRLRVRKYATNLNNGNVAYRYEVQRKKLFGWDNEGIYRWWMGDTHNEVKKCHDLFSHISIDDSLEEYLDAYLKYLEIPGNVGLLPVFGTNTPAVYYVTVKKIELDVCDYGVGFNPMITYEKPDTYERASARFNEVWGKEPVASAVYTIADTKER